MLGACVYESHETIHENDISLRLWCFTFIFPRRVRGEDKGTFKNIWNNLILKDVSC